ncbi:MAG: hypothetical protein Tp118DCM00d2C30442581_44 [Prokaryotic dsDNA virus sp.]|nr:MAG: hypothetical protein Tp118DCM00d2C30442581_44 [Prokaryotic dsDNA virus sp.]|tara:strand:- start:6248 stop:7225 length:978 start_codon:yes stop_codon:yes gene_type:complete
MSHINSINVNFVKQYGRTLDLLTQTMGGKFKGKCLEESIEGEDKFYDQLSSVTATEATTSGATNGMDSPLNDITHARRRVQATPYDVGLMIDRFDKLKLLVDPASEYVQQQVHALNRKSDIEFLKGALGGAQSGVNGGTSVPFNSTDTASQFLDLGTGAEAQKFTLEKIIAAKRTLETAGVDLDDPMNTAYIAVSPFQMHELLETSNAVQSIDYNSVKALVRGEINSFYGFQFCVSNLLPYMDSSLLAPYLSWTNDVPQKDGTGTSRIAFAWVKSGIRQVTNNNITTEIEKRADKRFNWYSYASMRTGAVRMEEEKVVVIPCTQA